MKLPPPDQLPAEMNNAQLKAVILHGIVNPSYPDQADEVLSYEIIAQGHVKATVRDGKKIIDFEIDGEDVTYGLADGSPDGKISLSETIRNGGVFDFAETQQASTVDQFVDRLRQKAQPEFERMTATVRELLDGSGDLTEFREKLDTAYPDLDGEMLTKIMGEAMFASKLAGIFEAEQE